MDLKKINKPLKFELLDLIDECIDQSAIELKMQSIDLDHLSDLEASEDMSKLTFKFEDKILFILEEKNGIWKKKDLT